MPCPVSTSAPTPVLSMSVDFHALTWLTAVDPTFILLVAKPSEASTHDPPKRTVRRHPSISIEHVITNETFLFVPCIVVDVICVSLVKVTVQEETSWFRPMEENLLGQREISDEFPRGLPAPESILNDTSP